MGHLEKIWQKRNIKKTLLEFQESTDSMADADLSGLQVVASQEAARDQVDEGLVQKPSF